MLFNEQAIHPSCYVAARGHWFAREDIARLHQFAGGPDAVALDGQTWSDLMLDQYAHALSGEVSIFGRQVLYQRLCGGLGADAWTALGERLRLLMGDQGLTIVSSHNVVLAPLLAHRLDPYCIRRDNGRLALEPGVLVEPNGIALLSAHGFSLQVQEKAAKVAHWLSGHLSERRAGADVLNADKLSLPQGVA